MHSGGKHFYLTFDHLRLRCEEHCHRGDLPCPWPDCQRGTPHDEIFGSFGPTDEKPFLRREWHALDGSLRYAWDQRESTSFWGCVPLIRAELERTTPKTKPISTIFHYTTVEGLIGIVESNDLWLTDYEFLNDATELRYGLNLLSSVLKDAAEANRDPRTIELIAAWSNKVETPPQDRVCLACFSSDGDSLSQWRGYGNGASAVAIGFDLQRSSFHLLHETQLGQVIYDPELQRLRLATAVHVHLQLDRWDEGKPDENNAYDIFAKCAFDRFFRDLVLFKHPSFAEEREIRLVYSEPSTYFDARGIKRAKERFRTKNGKIIPYTTARDLDQVLSEDDPPDALRLGSLPICEVIIGPQDAPGLLVSGIARLLTANDRINIRIRQSTVPYRSFG
jgi:hypothetical protein